MTGDITGGLRVAWVAMRTQARTMRGSPSSVILGVVQPVVFLLVAVGADSGRAGGTGLVVGVALTALWGSTIWSAGGILRTDLYGGTLMRWLTGVRSPAVVFLGRCLGATLHTTVIIVASTLITAAAVGVPLRPRLPLLMLAGLALVLLSVTALGMLLSCLFLVTRHATAWSATLMYPVFIISGIIIPLDLLPAPVRGVSALISLRWGARLLTSAVGGIADWSALAALAGLTVGYFAVAVPTFRRLLDRARREGSVDRA